MSECCGRPGYQTVFSDQFARRVAGSYRKRGLDQTERRLVSFLTDRGISNTSVLEIGGGVGEIQIELLRSGGGSTRNWELYFSVKGVTLATQGVSPGANDGGGPGNRDGVGLH